MYNQERRYNNNVINNNPSSLLPPDRPGPRGHHPGWHHCAPGERLCCCIARLPGGAAPGALNTQRPTPPLAPDQSRLDDATRRREHKYDANRTKYTEHKKDKTFGRWQTQPFVLQCSRLSLPAPTPNTNTEHVFHHDA
jgi:hypothetical protein